MQTATYNIREENTISSMVECIALGESHYNEVEGKSNKVPYSADFNTFKSLMDMRMISLITCRLDGELVGYFGNLVSKDLVTSAYVAKEIGIYVKPEHRQNGVLREMMKSAEVAARNKGATIQLVGFKKDHNEELPLSLGYDRTETVYQKFLGE